MGMQHICRHRMLGTSPRPVPPPRTTLHVPLGKVGAPCSWLVGRVSDKDRFREASIKAGLSSHPSCWLLRQCSTVWLPSVPSLSRARGRRLFSTSLGTSLVVLWLRLCAPNAAGLGWSPVEELDPTCHNQEPARHSRASALSPFFRLSGSCVWRRRRRCVQPRRPSASFPSWPRSPAASRPRRCPRSSSSESPVLLCLTPSAQGRRKGKGFRGGQAELSPGPLSAARRLCDQPALHRLSKLRFPHPRGEGSGGSFSELFSMLTSQPSESARPVKR